jgi:hypothetical protein
MALPKRLTLYADLMEELKARLVAIEFAISGRTGYPPPIVRELCYLQLRMLCELIALASLVAHGDVSSLHSHKLGKAYSADDILHRMEKLKPHFFPVACRQKQIRQGAFELEAIHPSPLPKSDLLKLYGKTHRHLHRGTLKAMMANPAGIDSNLNQKEITEWATRINQLLRVHSIAIDDDNMVLCLLRNSDDNNRVQVATAVKTVDLKL